MQIIMIVLLLAIFQGISEFIPISSSGHILVFSHWFFPADFNMSDSERVALNVLLHAGTLCSILVVYRKLIGRILLYQWRMLALIVVASVPTALVGLAIKYNAYWLETNLNVCALGFLATAFLLVTIIDPPKCPVEATDPFCSDPLKPKEKSFTFAGALFVGLFQGIAVLPGFSRTALTIAAAICCGARRNEAAAFSFLIAIPALIGAILLELVPVVLSDGTGEYALFARSAPLFLTASILSFVVGMVSLRLLIRWLLKGTLRYWAIWLLFLGIAILVHNRLF